MILLFSDPRLVMEDCDWRVCGFVDVSWSHMYVYFGFNVDQGVKISRETWEKSRILSYLVLNTLV